MSTESMREFDSCAQARASDGGIFRHILAEAFPQKENYRRGFPSSSRTTCLIQKNKTFILIIKKYTAGKRTVLISTYGGTAKLERQAKTFRVCM